MKALFVGPNLGVGGAERQTSILIPALRERGIDARVIALNRGGAFEESLRSSGVPVEAIGMRHQADVGRLLAASLVRTFRPDVVVSRGGVSGQYVGHALAHPRGAVHIYNDHKALGLSVSLRREAMTRLILRWLDFVVGVSTDQALAWNARGYPAERFVVIPNGVDAQVVPEPREQIRRELSIPPQAIVALIVATLRPLKQVPVFVAAVRRARETHPDLIGLIAGSGPEQAAIEADVLGDPAIRLLGQRSDVPRLLKAADMFVLTSRYEAAPMSILEAMAAGLPVVGARVGGIPDSVVHGESGLLVTSGDVEGTARSLAQLAGDGELRARMGAEAKRLFGERWTADAMADAYARLLETACA